MSNYFFTADTHFRHANIIKFCYRPFSSVEEMDSELIKRWNSVVKPDDIIYHLGDFSYKANHLEVEKIINQLNGKIYFVEGNHDAKGMMAYLHWCSSKARNKVVLLQRWELITVSEQDIHLCHFAPRSWSHDLRGTWALYGHTHALLPPYGKSCDVGVDAWDFTPVSFEQLREFFSKRPVGNHPGFPGYTQEVI